MAAMICDFDNPSEKPCFEIGNDGLPYAVFGDNGWSWEYNEMAAGHGIAHFGNYENAVLLQLSIGM